MTKLPLIVPTWPDLNYDPNIHNIDANMGGNTTPLLDKQQADRILNLALEIAGQSVDNPAVPMPAPTTPTLQDSVKQFTLSHR